MIDINLLPPEIRVLEKKARFSKIILFIGGVALLASVIFIIGVTVNYIIVKNNLSQNQLKLTTTTQEIATYKALEASAIDVTAKYKELQAAFKVRELYSQFFAALNGMVPQDVKVSEINFLATNKVSLSGESQGYLSLAGFVKTLEDPKTSKIFVNPVLNSVVLNSQTGKVQFVMELGLKEGSLLAK
ncbi:MAG: PilN domain-containing protein [candidate division WWE3 bacterium]|nr:PilN domain-containing protein [candidate division WWE3 bacterium]